MGNARRFFVWWVLSFLGFPVGGTVAILAVGSVRGVFSGALAGVLAGAVIGATQWFVLRGTVSVDARWIPATALGLALGDAAGALLTGAGTDVGSLLVTGFASGVAVGLLQWTLLGKRVRGAWLWPIVVALAWPLGWTVTWAVGVDVERGYAVFGSTGALVFVVLTGAALMIMRRG